MSGEIEQLRRRYHQQICERVMRLNGDGIPNNADKANKSSVALAKGVLERIDFQVQAGQISGQTAGRFFEMATRDFLRDSFGLLAHLRPGEWEFALGGDIDSFEQYSHLSGVGRLMEDHAELLIAFGDYIVKPDVVVFRRPVSDDRINKSRLLLSRKKQTASHTPFRLTNSRTDIMHASVSCKWTIRSDRSQNARTEGLNLVRNRKGRTPHIVVVVGEPLPGRIASLAFGTGDIDCVYHFALRELIEAASGRDSDEEMLATLVEGRRLRDISDLPFDLAI